MSGSNKAAPPITAVEPPSMPPRCLSEVDRICIADRLREKPAVAAIAAEPGRSPSTVSREIRPCNMVAGGGGGCCPGRVCAAAGLGRG
ncbi:helix-turn-helix domain-containing protein [Streptomyces sp. NPDC091268]|uniref:helix-turn-helix domain-containing protein n=1 Tax=Streptomyces sp. NPDC091268 TaxID=3365979 RepID=UPI00381BC851